MARGELELDESGQVIKKKQGKQKQEAEESEEKSESTGEANKYRRERRVVKPSVPFAPELLPEKAPNRRQRLARWLTHKDNPYFAKAIANRLWQWLLGTGVVEPLDELDSTKPRNRALLTLLSQDLIDHEFDLLRSIRAIVSSKAYRLSSAVPEGMDEHDTVKHWAAFALKPLRADQLASALTQTGSFWTYNHERAPLLRLARWGGINDFTKRHGDDLGAEVPEEETLLQRLQLLNGKKITELTKEGELFSPVPRLPLLSPSYEAAIENAFLMTLSRRPTAQEAAPFVEGLREIQGEKAGDARAKLMADLVWALLNTTEFAWQR